MEGVTRLILRKNAHPREKMLHYLDTLGKKVSCGGLALAHHILTLKDFLVSNHVKIEDDGSFYIYTGTIAAQAGYSQRNVRRSMKRLREVGWIDYTLDPESGKSMVKTHDRRIFDDLHCGYNLPAAGRVMHGFMQQSKRNWGKVQRISAADTVAVTIRQFLTGTLKMTIKLKEVPEDFWDTPRISYRCRNPIGIEEFRQNAEKHNKRKKVIHLPADDYYDEEPLMPEEIANDFNESFTVEPENDAACLPATGTDFEADFSTKTASYDNEDVSGKTVSLKAGFVPHIRELLQRLTSSSEILFFEKSFPFRRSSVSDGGQAPVALPCDLSLSKAMVLAQRKHAPHPFGASRQSGSEPFVQTNGDGMPKKTQSKDVPVAASRQSADRGPEKKEAKTKPFVQASQGDPAPASPGTVRRRFEGPYKAPQGPISGRKSQNLPDGAKRQSGRPISTKQCPTTNEPFVSAAATTGDPRNQSKKEARATIPEKRVTPLFNPLRAAAKGRPKDWDLATATALVDFWNTLPNVPATRTHDGRLSAIRMMRDAVVCGKLGSTKYPLTREFVEGNGIDVKRDFGGRWDESDLPELKAWVKRLADFFAPDKWPSSKTNIPRSLRQLIYNRHTGTSWMALARYERSDDYNDDVAKKIIAREDPVVGDVMMQLGALLNWYWDNRQGKVAEYCEYILPRQTRVLSIVARGIARQFDNVDDERTLAECRDRHGSLIGTYIAFMSGNGIMSGPIAPQDLSTNAALWGRFVDWFRENYHYDIPRAESFWDDRCRAYR